MDVQGFKDWLEYHRVGGKPNDRTIKGYIAKVKRVERIELLPSGTDIDAEFRRDGMAEIIGRFVYSNEDTIARIPHRNSMGFTAGVTTSSASYKSSINIYCKFCNNPIPIEAD